MKIVTVYSMEFVSAGRAVVHESWEGSVAHGRMRALHCGRLFLWVHPDSLQHHHHLISHNHLVWMH